MMRTKVRTFCVLVSAVLLAGISTQGRAVDGVVLIDQNRAMTGNVTPGDAPGFPVSINQPGSYKLASNLTVPDGNTTAIQISANHVTLDLNGFSILGPVDCSAGFPCANAAQSRGYGVLAGVDIPVQPYFDISVRNGSISGMGADGVHLLGDTIRVEDLRIRDSGLSAIVVRAAGFVGPMQTNLLIARNSVQRNFGYGVKTDGGIVTDNVISDSGGTGIYVAQGGGLVARNLVSRSAENGLLLVTTVSYIGNTLVGNTVAVIGGLNAGQNLCDSAICPNARY